MLPVIAVVGRPNVGKSTLFNYLTRTRDALVADYPGLTRDRQYGRLRRGDREALLVDTGGIIEDSDGVEEQMLQQVQTAVDDADIILFLVDARAGLSASDEAIANQLRKTDNPVCLVANKTDGINAELETVEFYGLGLGNPIMIAASHGRGIHELLDHIEQLLPEKNPAEGPTPTGIAIAVVGRPNVGKSTLVNRLLGEERVVVFDQPGTTRDSIFIPFERDGMQFTLIDTAGMRRRARISEAIEKFSVIKAMQAIDKANVVIYLVDASEGVTDQDASLLGLVLDAGRAIVIGLNKWDGLTAEQREKVKRQLDVKLPFLGFSEKHTMSALHGTGVGELFSTVHEVYAASMIDMSTPTLTHILEDAVIAHQPPLVRGRRVKLKYAHQGGHNPPVIVIHGNQTKDVPASYKRYLENLYREKLGISGTPIRIEFRATENPFKDRRNKLTPRQVHKRKRLMRFVKKKK